MIIKSRADRKLVMQGPAYALPSAQPLELGVKFKVAHLLKPHGVRKCWPTFKSFKVLPKFNWSFITFREVSVR